MKLGFIGTGKISSSVISGICKSKIKYSKIYISPRNNKIAKTLKKKFNKIIIAKTNQEIINNSDVCITRSGASTLAELSLLNIPFIAVPLPNSKDDHQFENALFYKEKECCWMLNQDTFEDNIEQLLNNILSDNSEFLQKKENLKKLNYKNTWTNVHQKILNIINEN